MSSIQIKRGYGPPSSTDLLEGELGFNKSNNKLYVGTEQDSYELFGPTAKILDYQDYKSLKDSEINENTIYFCTDEFDEILTQSNAFLLLGITATKDELNILDGVITSTTELNYVKGVTSNIQTQLNGKQSTITGGATTITSSNLTTSRALVSNTSGKVAVSSVTSTELGYISGVTSNVQTQLNSKQATITGGATTITSSNLTASRALVSDTNGKVAVSAVTSTELGYLDGVTSSVQTQFNTMWQKIYPVGAIYISYVATSPATLFGGTWTAITGRFLYCNSGTGTGGSNTHTLTVAEMPSHQHRSANSYSGAVGDYFGGSSADYGITSGTNTPHNSSYIINSSYVGGGSAHNNMPAYQTVYAWRRTA